MPKVIYWSGIYKNVGEKLNFVTRKKLKAESKQIQSNIINLLDFFSKKQYHGEKKKDKENINIVILKDKTKHFDFLNNVTAWGAKGIWRNP